VAYLRYDRKCEWYIFWNSPRAKAKEQERVAVWHVDHRAGGPDFSYAEVREMLRADDFSRVPGFSQRDGELVRQALSEFVADVDGEYSHGAG
jgi:hypothetical protein